MKVYWERHHNRSQLIDDQSLMEAFEVKEYTAASKFETFLPKPSACPRNDDFELIHDTFIEPKLTIREGVIRTLQKQLDPNLFRPDSTEIHEEDEEMSDDKHIVQNLQSQGFFSLIDISNALAMSKEEKTMSRVLIELRKVHKNIGEKANRYGRRF